MSGSPRHYEFVQVDVFTDTPLGGNPLAVVLDGRGLSDAEMQAVAREMNLSETTFILPPEQPEHAARVRIFTPGIELPFAGHPTVGTAWVMAMRGMVPAGLREFVLGEGIGPVPVRMDGEGSSAFVWMRHPAVSFGPPIAARAEVAAALGLTAADLLPDTPVQTGSTGAPFLYVALRDAATVDRAVLNSAALEALVPAADAAHGVFIFTPRAEPPGAYSRMLAFAGTGISEDPATGSASGPLGALLVRHGLVPPGSGPRLLSEQGTAMGRRSLIQISVTGDPAAPIIEVGGQVAPVIKGVLTLP